MLGIAVAPPGARFHGTLPRYGAPVHTADYADGFKQCAYFVQEDPTIGADAGRVYFSWQYDTARMGWAQLALPDQPRPLYRPENLESHLHWPVYVFEREDMVDAFHTLSGDAEVIATTVPGGCTKFDMGEWEALYGRTVVLWPTKTKESLEGMHALGRRLLKAGSKVSVLQIPQDKPAGWSFLQVVEAGWTWEQCEEFIRTQRQEAVSTVVPIQAARARVGGAPPILAPAQPTPRQPATQTQGLPALWGRIPGLVFAPNGTPYSHLSNTVATLATLPAKFSDVWYDEFHARVMTDPASPRAWTDIDTFELTAMLQGQLGFAAIRPVTVWEALTTYAMRHPRNEVREWLDGLEWDGQQRLLVMLHRGWGVEATPYASSVGRCFMVGAVARIYRPGCQCDHVPVFEGPGGAGKTSALRILFGKWFDNPSALFGDKDFLQNMRGKWCLELAELANMRGRSIEIVKAVITRTEDNYRAPYAREPAAHARQCIFAATTDQFHWNTDRAGGRRWWPFLCGDIDLEWIAAKREQLFAEAVYRFKDGEPWHNVQPADAREQQQQRKPSDVWHDILETRLAGYKEVSFVHVCELLMGENPRDWTPQLQDRAMALLEALGWQKRLGIWSKPPQ